jgi:hypothetical protein
MYIGKMNFSTVNYGKNSGLKNDTEDFEKQSQEPLKYYTTNWNSVLKSDAGINFVEGYGKPPGFTDAESQLIRSTVTNPKVRQNYGMLPLVSGGSLRNTGPVISESNSRERKSCQPTDNEHYKRSFYDLVGFTPIVENKSRSGSDSRQDGRTSFN